MGITSVLLTCAAGNERSRRVILHNGGILENVATDEDGVPVERYWIGSQD